MTKFIRFNGTRFADVLGLSESTLNQKIAGKAGDDTIFGGSGNDKIKGNAGNDWIFAGGGNDENEWPVRRDGFGRRVLRLRGEITKDRPARQPN